MAFRPALRPGAPLLRRSATHLQVGTSPGIVVADRPGLLPLLRLVDGARDVPRLEAIAAATIPELVDDVGALLLELLGLGVVFDASLWGGAGPLGPAAEARHAAVSGVGQDRLAARHRARLAFHHDIGSTPVVQVVRAILVESGLAQLDSPDPQLLVVVTCGEASRSVFERPSLHRMDHLPVVVDEDRVRIGPLVQPGRTPCVSCHDLHRADWDRAWPALVHQLGRHTRVQTPPAVDAVTAHAAAVELAVEVITHVEGRTPRTLGACLGIGPRHDDRATWPIAFHPACHCDLLHVA